MALPDDVAGARLTFRLCPAGREYTLTSDLAWALAKLIDAGPYGIVAPDGAYWFGASIDHLRRLRLAKGSGPPSFVVRDETERYGAAGQWRRRYVLETEVAVVTPLTRDPDPNRAQILFVRPPLKERPVRRKTGAGQRKAVTNDRDTRRPRGAQ